MDLHAAVGPVASGSPDTRKAAPGGKASMRSGGANENVKPEPVVVHAAGSPTSHASTSSNDGREEKNAYGDIDLIEQYIQPENIDAAPKPYQARERIRRIHLPVREGMDELSEDEGDWSEWNVPDPDVANTESHPPGYDGPRRKRNPADEGKPHKIKPSYYYPTEGSSRGVPVFEPTMEEFRDFNSFITNIDNYGMRAGIVKVVPPKEWLESLASVSQPLKDTVIREPIEQNFMGSRGLFRQSNIASRRVYNVKQWKEMCDSDKYRTPNFFGAEEEERPAAAPAARKRREPTTSTTASPAKKARGRPAKKGKVSAKKGSEQPDEPAEDATLDNDESMMSTAQEVKAEDQDCGINVDMDTVQDPDAADAWEKKLNDAQLEKHTENKDEKAADVEVKPENMHVDGASAETKEVATTAHANKSKQASPTADPSEEATKATSPEKTKRKTKEEQAEAWDKEWETFDYTSLPWGAKPGDFTVEECKKIERTYWKRFSLGAPPMYGADGSGSLFDESTKDWNIAALDDLLMRINPHMPMPGVNTPYLYFGQWRATFAWHVEDADLYSINYIHFGSPKFWYSVPQEHAERFERVMAGYFPRDKQKCPEFLRHKSFLVSPTNLAKDGIPLNRVVQFPGEIILTYPYGYHSGFNMGFNCAESINFATEGWLDIGRKARPCVCLPDTVRINVDKWLEEARQDAQRMRDDPDYAALRKWEKEYSKAIPQHVARKRRVLGPLYDQQLRNRPVLKEEVEEEESKSEPPAKPVPQVAAPKPAVAPVLAAGHPSLIPYANKKQVAIPAAVAAPSTSAQAVPITFPCALCPERSLEGLVKVANPGNAKGHRGKQLFAHKVCVTFTPTTWCAPDPVTGEETVYGFELIEKDRWALKCGLCPERHGTKIQCTKSAKCVRAFHATCALKEGSGVVLDAVINGKSVLEPLKPGETHAFGDGHLQLVVSCRQHNPIWLKHQAERKKMELAHRVLSIAPGTIIQVRTTTGVFDVRLLGHYPDQQTIEIMFADGKRAVCKHAALVWPDEAAAIASKAPAPVAQPRAHPMDRSRAGSSGTNNTSSASTLPNGASANGAPTNTAATGLYSRPQMPIFQQSHQAFPMYQAGMATGQNVPMQSFFMAESVPLSFSEVSMTEKSLGAKAPEVSRPPAQVSSGLAPTATLPTAPQQRPQLTAHQIQYPFLYGA